MSVSFRVSDAQLLDQLAELSLTSEDGDHLLPLDADTLLLSTDGAVRMQQAAAYLTEGEWSSQTFTTCGQPDCVRPDHCTISAVKAQEVKDVELLDLVERTSAPSLASLYRRARNKGLLTARSDYGG